MNTSRKQQIEFVLNKLHNDAENDHLHRGKSSSNTPQPSDFEHAYLPISKGQGQHIRNLIIQNNCKQIVEFGTSFGISTIYLADAAQQTGGNVVTTELLESKALKASENIKEAGLIDLVEFRIGDAMETLKGYSSPIDFLFLDGWKDLYLPLFLMLEPNLHANSMIYADNIEMETTRPYSDYISQKPIYSSIPIDGGKGLLTNITSI